MTIKYKDCFSKQDLLDNIKLEGGIRAAARAINEAATLYEEVPYVTESGIRNFLKKENTSEKPKKKTSSTKADLPIAAGVISAPDTRRERLVGTRFVFTAAQNNTLVHEDFLASLFTFCQHNDADLVVSRFTYNKSGFQNSTKDSENKELWYDERLKEFICDRPVEIADDLVFCGELDILPTAGQPLSGFENYTQGNSGIIPHAKVNLVSLPRLKGENPRFLYTTGAVTLRNYIQRKAGQKADFHHVFGALYVEIDQEGRWFARQLIANNSGEFYDLSTKYTPNGVQLNQEVMAVNYGDIHIEKIDPDVVNATWDNEDSLSATLRPTYQFIHDLTDFTARNHHNIRDPYFLAEQYWNGQGDVEDGLRRSAEFLEKISNTGIVVVVESNHDQAYQRWLQEADIRPDPANAEFFHRSNARVHKAIRENDKDFSVYEWALQEKSDLVNVIFLREDDSFVICNDAEKEDELGKIVGGIECGMHGHRGPNGARGNARQFKQIGRKCNLGHSHNAAIIDGVYVAGVSGKLDMDYNKGPSSWSHSHILTYPNGKRAIITIKDGKWRA